MSKRRRAQSSTVGLRRGRGRVGKALFGLICACVLALGAFLGSGASALAAETCSNETLRSESNPNPFTGEAFSLGLPECRAYEMVSPPVKAGVNTTLAPAPWISEDGDAIAYYAGGAFAGAESNRGSQNVYLARRTGSEWQTEPLVLPSWVSAKSTNATPLALSTDLSKALLLGADGASANGDTLSDYRLFIRQPDGTYVHASPELPADVGTSNPIYMGGAPDLSSVILYTAIRLVPGDSGSGFGLYVVTGTESGSPQVHRVDVDNAGVPLSPIGIDGAYTSAGNFHFVSDDGSTVFISAGGNASGTTHGSLYVRHLTSDGTGTTTTVAPSGSTLLAGSADGSRAIFLSSQQLVPGDTDATPDLYEYDAENPAGGQLVQLSAGDPSGANVLGLVLSSDDATHAYFVATGVLTSNPNQDGQSAQVGADNLYLNERVRDAQGIVHTHTVFVDLLCSGTNASGSVADPGCGGSDAALWALPTGKMVQGTVPDARYLTLATFAQLTPDDTDAAQDIYRYDSETGEVSRVSHAVEGFGTDGNGAVNSTIAAPTYRTNLGLGANVYSQRSRALSDDGSEVVFETTEALAPGDDNNALDVYGWHADPLAPGGGTVSLISSGHDGGPFTTVSAPGLVDPSGRNVFFAAADPLVTQDNDSGLRDVYDARMDGGYPAVHPAAQCDPVADPAACQGLSGPAPANGQAGSTSPPGTGNAAPLGAVVISGQKAVTGPRARLKVTTPVSGRIALSGGGINKATKTANGAGTYPVSVALNSKARHTLHNGKRVTVQATLIFRSDSGSTLTKGVSIKFKPPARKRNAHAKKKGSH